MSDQEVKVNPFVQLTDFAVMGSCIDTIEAGDMEEPWGDAQTAALENCLKTTYYYTPYVALGFKKAYKDEKYQFKPNQEVLEDLFEEAEEDEEKGKAPQYTERDAFLAHAHAYMSSRHVPLHLQDVIIEEAVRMTLGDNRQAE